MHSLIASFAILASLANAQNGGSIDCKNVQAGSATFDLSPLSQPMTVHKLGKVTTGIRNLTFTFDPCKPLSSPHEGCPEGTSLCAARYLYKDGKGQSDEDAFNNAWPITGANLPVEYGPMNAMIRRINNNNEKGVRVLYNGGVNNNGMKQRANVAFICDPSKKGTEGPQTRSVSMETFDMEFGAAADGGSKLPDPDKGQPLQFDSYARKENGDGPKEKLQVLKLIWKTKYACEDTENGDGGNGGDSPSNAGWGFFTWFILIFFLAIASYLIFGSWLNYTRYGARGWDLLPHGDTIRDIPYLLKDWARSLLSTVQGGGRRDLGYIRV